MYDPDKNDPFHGIAMHVTSLSEIAKFLVYNEDRCDPNKMATVSYYLKRLEQVSYDLRRVEARMYYMEHIYGENHED